MKGFAIGALILLSALLSSGEAAVSLGRDTLQPTVQRWTPPGVSSPSFESHAAFDPRTGDFYFVRSTPRFTGWRIMVTRCTAGGWATPESPAFAGDGVEADPYITPDGRTFYFNSTRTTDGVKGRSLDLWRMDRAANGDWGTPVRLPEPLNSAAAEWFPRPASDGWFYFGSDRAGGQGATDIWRARRDASGTWTVSNPGSSINSAEDEYEATPSPDGTRLIVMRSDGLWESKRSGSDWAPRVKLGPDVNQNGSEIGAMFSPTGQSFLFSRDTKEPNSGEFFVRYEQGREAWPPACSGSGGLKPAGDRQRRN